MGIQYANQYLIFNDCLKEGKFPSNWEKVHVVHVHKNRDKQCLRNYRPISLLPIYSKIFERLVYNELFTCLTDNLISPNQSGFRSGGSCVNQLIAITHELYKSFDDGLEVRGIFLDISKAFDTVLPEGLRLKLSLNGISRNLLKLLHDFLYCRKPRVVLTGQSSSWENVKARIPQGSILGPLLFLIYINDLSNGVSSNCKLFADYTSLFSVVNDIQSSAATLRNDLTVIRNWAFQWKMIFNRDLTRQAQEVIFSRKTKKLLHLYLLFNEISLKNSISKISRADKRR